jgi:hypothetical protein
MAHVWIPVSPVRVRDQIRQVNTGSFTSDGPIVLDIRAEPEPGNLLGDLLCAVVGVLDGTGVATTGSGLQNQLDQINVLLAGA